MNKLSIIVPTYKEPEYLDLCLGSAIQGCNNLNNIEIIVVVDGFYDINKDVLSKYKDNVKIVVLDENQGLCRATNLGAYNAKYDTILVVNDDNVFPQNYDVSIANSVVDRYKNYVVSFNQIEPTPSMFKQFVIKNLGTDAKSFDLKAYWGYEKTISKNTFDNTGSTLPFMMNKLDFIKIGGWDENYPTNGVVADWDFFLKCMMNDMKMYRYYCCNFYHFSQVATGKNRKQIENEAHNYAKYKWGKSIQHDPATNLKYL